MHFLWIIFIILIILAISKLIMETIKKRDRRNGLQLDDKYYSITGTLFSPINQDKRIEREQRLKFVDFNIDKSMWKKTYILYMGLASIALGIGIFFKCDIIGVILTSAFITFIFFSRRIIFLIPAGITIIYSLLYYDVRYNISNYVIVPAFIIFGYVIIKDYKKYRKKLSNKTI